VQFRQLLACALGVFSATFASIARAEEPGAPVLTPPAPAADLPPPGARTTHIVAGAATTVVSYGLAFGASYLFEEQDLRGSRHLRIPLAGPWMTLGKLGCPTSDPDCSAVGLVLGAMLLVADGVSQAGGLAIIGEGLFLRTSSRSAPKRAEGPTVHAVPLSLGKGGAGLGIVGTF
jgi:hypothetical protein